jgi:hypothetical protein
MKKDLLDITLIGVDCIDLDRLKRAADICQKDFHFGKVVLLSSIKDDDPRVIWIPEIKSIEEYSEFCIKEMCKFVNTSHALIFQYDGFILNPSAWHDEFLTYDYIGSPWHHMGFVSVGGGGFSLRSRRLLDFISKNYEKIGGKLHPEDLWICSTARHFLEKEGIKFAPVEVANRFSINGDEHGVVWDGEFGWHGIRDTDISKWTKKHPEYKNFFPQKLNDFSSFMLKYPVYDGTVHVFLSKPIQVSHYKKLANGEKDYDCRFDDDLVHCDPIKLGHKIVYRLWRILLSQVGVPTFERTVKSIEKFKSKKELLRAHPEIKITPSFHIPKWKQRLAEVFGNTIYPNNKSYTLIKFTSL